MTEIDQIRSALPGTFPALGLPSRSEVVEGGQVDFADLLAQAIGKVQELGAESDRLTIDLALGRPVELHQVMLAATKAGLALELLIELRNKVIEAYQEISRMPV